MNKKIVLGIDPGIGRCGFGVIKFHRNRPKFGDCGVIETPGGLDFPERLCELRADFIELCERFQPNLLAIEKLFFTKNITTGIDVAGARGVILQVAAERGLPIVEIAPQGVKMAVCGVGNATKNQIQEMTVRILNLPTKPRPDDAADALAVALAAQNFLE